MEKIDPVSYLVSQNVERYRIIMRHFYKSHRQMQGTLYRPDIIRMMREEFSNVYGEIEVDQDLESLVTWGNLQKQQEMIRPKSIEEYRNKNFRYQITESGILVEEMVYQLTHQKHAARGALDEEGVRRLLELLRQLFVAEDTIVIWQEIREEFRNIGYDTANYIGYITSPDVDSRMKTEQFLIYKDKFVNYLRDFISTLQHLYPQFLLELKKFDDFDVVELINQMYQKESEVPMMETLEKAEIAEQIEGEISAIKYWFIGTADRPSEYQNLMMQTDQMISKITGLIYFFGQEVHQYQSRKKDYLQLARWFAQADSLEQAHKMYAGIFGLDHSRHFFVSEASSATNTQEDSWQLTPGKLFMGSRGRGERLERRARSFVLDLEKQKQQLEEYQQQQLEQRKKIERYFENNQLDFEKITNLDAHSRKIFLRWISLAIANFAVNDKQQQATIRQTILSEFDFPVTVTVEKYARIAVSCEDGVLEMPKITMERGNI